MENIHAHAPEILILIFLTVTFLQSGIDKVTDWQGNVSFITSHFKNSPLHKITSLLVAIILVMELVAGAMMLVGVFHILITGDNYVALLGTELAALSLIFLLIGQRLAKDYVGAMTLAVYFIIAVFGVFLLNN